MTRVGAAVRSGVTELQRTPLLLGLLVVAPAYVVYLFGAVAPEGTAVVRVSGTAVRTTLSAAFPAFTTPMSAALLSGVAGLFLMETAAEADARLVVAGYRPRQVVVARLALLAVLASVATAVSVGVMLTAFTPESTGWFLVGTGLAALVYGAVGVIVGVLFDRLVGVYVIMFGSMIDLFVFQNPMATDAPAAASLLPGHYPLRVAMEAAFVGSADLTAVAWTLAYLGGLAVVAAGAFFGTVRVS